MTQYGRRVPCWNTSIRYKLSEFRDKFLPGASFQFFLGERAKIFYYFSMPLAGLLKNWRKTALYICSNLTLFIVPFFFFFFLFLGGDAPSPPQMTPLVFAKIISLVYLGSRFVHFSTKFWPSMSLHQCTCRILEWWVGQIRSCYI